MPQEALLFSKSSLTRAVALSTGVGAVAGEAAWLRAAPTARLATSDSVMGPTLLAMMGNGSRPAQGTARRNVSAGISRSCTGQVRSGSCVCVRMYMCTCALVCVYAIPMCDAKCHEHA